MYKVHGYLKQRRVIDWRMPHIPARGDTIRLSAENYAVVTEVVWCLDEESPEGQRVNLNFEPLPQPQEAHDQRRL